MENGMPIDDRQLESPLCVTAPEAKKDFETGVELIDKRTGFPVWLVGVAVRRIGDRKATAIEVKVIDKQPPAVVVGQAVRLVDLQASYWRQPNGTSGIAYRATAIVPATQTVAGTPGASTGSAPLSASRPAVKSGGES